LLIFIGTRYILDAVSPIEVVLIFIMIGIPYPSKERVSPCFLIIVPGWRHAIGTPVTRFKDGIRLAREYVSKSAFPLERLIHVAIPPL